eukprot:jgi/Astpho2/6504/Aster-06964
MGQPQFGGPQQQYPGFGGPQQEYPGYQQPGLGGSQQQPGFGGGQQQPAFGGAQQQQGGNLGPALQSKLQAIVQTNSLQAFYPPQRLQQVVTKLQKVDFRSLAQRWRMPLEMALDLAVLGLYDIFIYADDSSSMKYVDKGERIDDLNAIVEKVTEVATLFDDDGITCRFMNSPACGDNIRDPGAAQKFIRTQSKYEGMTPMGSQLEAKILHPFLGQALFKRNLEKPMLVICVTDGEPTQEPQNRIFEVIMAAKRACLNSQYGGKAVAFMFAQVGKDQGAQQFLQLLDSNRDIGDVVDAVSYYELEAEEYAKKGITLSPELWLVKLMVGAIDPSYDEGDEG